MFAQIGDLLPRLRIYERLFRDHERVIQALSAIYCDILQFCADAKTSLRRSKRATFNRTWKSFDRDFGQVISGFQRHHDNIEKEVKTSHLIEWASQRDSSRNDQLELATERQGRFNPTFLNFRLMSCLRAEKERWRVFGGMSAVDYEGQLAKLSSLRHKGTCSWFLNHPIYIAWKAATQSQGLYCSGIRELFLDENAE